MVSYHYVSFSVSAQCDFSTVFNPFAHCYKLHVHTDALLAYYLYVHKYIYTCILMHPCMYVSIYLHVCIDVI